MTPLENTYHWPKIIVSTPVRERSWDIQQDFWPMFSGYDDDCLSIFLSECHTTVRFEFKSKNPHKNPLMGKCTWNTSAQETETEDSQKID